MPTGYTSYINDGKITNGADFLKLCTRAFGVAVDLKDETPKHFEPDPYYKESYEKAVNKRDKYRKMTLNEARQDFINQAIENINSAREHLKNIIEENDRRKRCKKLSKMAREYKSSRRKESVDETIFRQPRNNYG